MSSLLHGGLYDPPGIYQRIASAIRQQGWCVIPDALPIALSQALFNRVIDLGEQDFDRAGVGRDEQHQLNQFVRRDEIRWLGDQDPAERDWQQWIQGLRTCLNQQLFLGLFSYESHFAHYPPGAFYRKHLDAFQGQSNRVLSTVLYLNPGWILDDGGELVLFDEHQTDTELHRVLPLFGTLVVFLSEAFPHEVLPAYRDRYSIAGWYRVNSSVRERVDPPR